MTTIKRTILLLVLGFLVFNFFSLSVKAKTTKDTEINNINEFQIKKDTKQIFHFDCYKDIGIVINVEQYLEIHKYANIDSEIIGRLPLNGGCTIISIDDDFTEITSGVITGYVESKYLATEEEASIKALEISYELADIKKDDTKIYYDKNMKNVKTTVKKGTRFLISEKTLSYIKVEIDENSYGYIEIDDINIIPELKEATEYIEPIRVVVEEGSVSGNYSYGSYSYYESPSTGDLRTDIVNYAKSFIGNPYVWGGTNPYTGADCSGFVQYVYAHFGYSLPRTTYNQWNWAKENGKVIDASEARAGDLVMYGDHVAILTGNGNEIVHASNSAPYPEGGIKTTDNYAYRNYWGIIRVI